jgi:hypothetical protein
MDAGHGDRGFNWHNAYANLVHFARTGVGHNGSESILLTDRYASSCWGITMESGSNPMPGQLDDEWLDWDSKNKLQ